jgi:hypothetical protein
MFERQRFDDLDGVVGYSPKVCAPAWSRIIVIQICCFRLSLEATTLRLAELPFRCGRESRPSACTRLHMRNQFSDALYDEVVKLGNRIFPASTVKTGMARYLSMRSLI